MDLTTLAVAGMSLIGTLAGPLRTYKLEGQMTEVQHDIRDLKSEVRT